MRVSAVSPTLPVSTLSPGALVLPCFSCCPTLPLVWTPGGFWVLTLSVARTPELEVVPGSRGRVQPGGCRDMVLVKALEP